MANPPAPDVKALATKLAAEWLDTRVAYERNMLAVALASALTAHTASLREKVEELEREHSILSLALKEAGDRNVTLIAERTEAEADANRMREALEEIASAGTREELRQVGDAWADSGWEHITSMSPEAEIARAALSPRPADEPVTQGER